VFRAWIHCLGYQSCEWSNLLLSKLFSGSVSEHFANLRHKKEAKLASEPECTILGYQSCETSILLHWTQNDVWECFRAFRWHSTSKRCKPCVSVLNTLFRGAKVVKHSFYSIGPKMMFWSVSAHFANLRQVKTSKTCVSSLNTLFRGTKDVKHLFYSIGPKMMFESV
jgi:hypothetical protein